MPTVAEVFALAKNHHQAGLLPQAELCYWQVVQADPRHAEAWCMLGLISQARGNLPEAATNLQRAVQLAPSYADAHTNLANIYVYQERYDEAITHYQQALRINPGIFTAQYILAIALQNKGRLDEAVYHFQQALAINPHLADAHNYLGTTLVAQNRLEEAAASYRQALRLNPNFADAWCNLGTVLDRQNKSQEAIEAYQQTIRLNPACAPAYGNMALAFEHQDKIEEAIRCYRQALTIKPDDAGACINLGNVYHRQDKFDEAIQYYREAVRLRPTYAEGWTNLGNALRDSGQFEEALASFEQALKHNADLVGPHHNRALLWLLLGDWAKGLPEYEWRWQTDDFPRYDIAEPRWDGSPLGGRTLLLLAEQGLGDTLQFVRYVPRIQKSGGRVIVMCQPQLHRLFADFLGPALRRDPVSPRGGFDCYAPLLSLPSLMGTAPATIPAEVPYLHADAGLVEHWRQQFDSLKGFKIGITWQGNPKHIDDRHRSIPLTHFARLAKVPGVHLISLQKGAGVDQLQTVAGRFTIQDVGSRLEDFADTAAVVKNLDLVISCDTAVVHLAGALGAPVWVALPFLPDWRWMLRRQDNPWYPTMRLFRKSLVGGWSELFERMALELEAMGSQKR